MPPLLTRLEDVDHHVDRLVGAGHLLDVQVDVANAEDVIEAADELALHGGELGELPEPGDVLPQSRVPLPHQRGNIDPERVVLHA